MRLHVIKAKEGDSLLLESGDATPRFMLIDGGPHGCWADHARPYLKTILGEAGHLDILAVSHVDNDHVIAPLDLLAAREKQRVNGDANWPGIGEIWHNSFEATIDEVNGPVSQAVRAVVAGSAAARTATVSTDWVFAGINEGARLRRAALREKIPLNRAYGSDLLSPDQIADPVTALGTTDIRLVGPTRANLEALRAKWREWARTARNARSPEQLANLDKSVPNLSSLVFVAEEKGRRILFTGDARGDHIEEGLRQAGLTDDNRVHFDVLKLQHHGSKRNIDRAFLNRVTADIYAVSANGKHDNPDYDTLVWLVEAVRDQGRKVEIVATYETASTEKLRETHPASEFGYRLRIPRQGEHAVVIELE